MPKVNKHKRAIDSAVRNYLSSCPIGKLVSSPNVLFDLNLDTEDMINDNYVSAAVSKIKRDKFLEKHGKFLDERGHSKKFSRRGKRGTKVYMIEEYQEPKVMGILA